MATFSYDALRGPGSLVSGEIDAQDERAAISTLVSRGYHVIHIEGGELRRKSLHFGIGGGLKRRDLARFTRDLSYLIKAGLPLTSALATVQGRLGETKWNEMASGIRARLEDGQTFSKALGAYPRVFDAMYTNLVHAGEESGTLANVLNRLSELCEKRNETRGRIQMAMVYPAVMMALGCVTVLVLLTFVVPRFAQVFHDTGQALPLPTEILVQGSEFLRTTWIALFIAGGAAIFLALRFARTQGGRDFIDACLFRVPVLKAVLHGAEVASFARTLGTLLQSGIPISRALSIVSATLRASRYRVAVKKMEVQVHEGRTLSKAIHQTQQFPPSLPSIVAVGEESGSLAESLLQAAEETEQDTARELKILMTLIEPAMIIIVGAIVGFIVAAMILPIFELGEAIQ